ncbi:MAG: pilus assembly protein PilP [Myxococcota bacterium]
MGLLIAVIAASFSFTTVACGGDEPSSVKPPPRKAGGKARKKKGKGKGNQGRLQAYPRIEQLVDDEEATTLRHRFVAGDFDYDSSGNVNRDPFRSFVIGQRDIGSGGTTSGTSAEEPTEVCSSKNLVAANYSLRDLKLVGIVLRGTSSYALFRDSGSYGHIVRKGDCLGQEKARVASIRAGFVNLEVIPESASGQEPTVQPRRLYPEDLTLEEP